MGSISATGGKGSGGPADENDALLGVTLDNRFRVVGIVGKGAMGKVYRAVQIPLNRPVALKVLDSNFGVGREESFRQRFLVEAALTAKLMHPNTVRVLDYGVTPNGIMYLAMEYLDGETLERVFSKGPLHWRRALTIGQQTARALREAHELGVVHRDLKPANIMLLSADDDTDHVKVLDFGLVKSFVDGQELEGRAVTQQGMLMGSPPYMAPEQGERNRADPRSDIYSLGVVLFEALQGKPPFIGRQPLEIILKHVNDPVPKLDAPQGLEPIPEAMEALVRKCLEKSPMDRFQSMDEVLHAMSELASPISTPNLDTPIVSTETLVPNATRKQLRIAVMVLGFSLAIAVGVLLTTLAMRRPTPRAIPVATAAAPPEPKAPAKPERVLFHVESEPSGATVAYGKKVLGMTPLEFSLLAEPDGTTHVQLLLTKDGYQPLMVEQGGSGPRIELRQTLQRLAPVDKPKHTDVAAAPSKPSRKSLEKKSNAAAKLDELDDPLAPHAPPSTNELKRPTP